MKVGEIMARKTKRTKITDEVTLNAICQENKQLLNDFLGYLSSIQRTKETIEKYTSDLNIFFCWNVKYNNNIPFVNLKKRHFLAFQNWLSIEQKSPARFRRMKSVISSLSNFIEDVLDDEYPDFRNLIIKIKSPPNNPVREKTVLTDEQIESLLSCLVENTRFQEACIFALALYSGSRKAELTRFKYKYFTSDNIICSGALYKTPEEIQAKGKKQHKYTLAIEFQPYLELWLKQRCELGIDNEWLFVCPQRKVNKKWEYTDPKNCKQITIAWLNSLAKEFSKFLGVDFYFHSCRHNITSRLAKHNIPDSVIADMIGWSSIEMVKRYNDNPADEAFNQYFGSEGIKKVEQGTVNNIQGGDKNGNH